MQAKWDDSYVQARAWVANLLQCSPIMADQTRMRLWVKIILGGIVVLAVIEILVGLLQAFAIIPG